MNIFPSNKSNKKNKFIFSIGDTDIRFIFYKSLKLKTFKNIDDLLIKYTEILDDYIKYLKTNINKFYSNSEIFFLEILLNDSHGYVTDNIDDLKIFIKHNNFVLLGSKNDYFNWTNYVNDIVKEACNKHNITFIKTNYVVNNNNNNNLLVNNGLSFDGVHIANLDYLNKMFNQLQ